MGLLRIFTLIAAVAMNGCWVTPHAQEVAELRQQADALTARVNQLELAEGSAPPAAQGVTAAAAATAPAQLAAQEATPLGAAQPFRWPVIEWHKALSKLLRGVTNVVTGWVEVPKRIHETTERSGAGAGFTYGFVRGLGYGFVRTAAGAYETVTFPFPAPPDFRPVMQPAYVFLCDTPTASSQP